MAYFSIVRPINLLLVAFTQILIYRLVLVDISKDSGVLLELNSFQFTLLICTTILIAASGYIINDIIDVDIDRINKRDKQIVGTIIPVQSAWYYYVIILSIGAIIALYIAYQIDHLYLFTIYPSACFLLYGYSVWWKKRAWIGNVIVSLFTAFVPFILVFAERDFYYQLGLIQQYTIIQKIGGFMIFAFILNLIREIIKDLEDQKGDALNGYKTAPICYPLSTIKIVCNTLVILDIAIVVFAMKYLLRDNFSLNQYIGLVLILGLHIYIWLAIYYSNNTTQYKRISALLKITMLVGMITLVVL